MLSLVTKSLKILHYENKISKYRVVVILCFKRVGQTILPSFRLQYMTFRCCLRSAYWAGRFKLLYHL